MAMIDYLEVKPRDINPRSLQLKPSPLYIEARIKTFWYVLLISFTCFMAGRKVGGVLGNKLDTMTNPLSRL